METKEIGVQIDLAATGQRIEQLREERGLSMADMASFFLKAYTGTYYSWEKPSKLIKIENLAALAYLFDVEIEDILVIKDPEVE